MFIQGDQFLGYNVDPSSGDLILRYWFMEEDLIDANGVGYNRSILATERKRKAVIGRPIIFAPDQMQGGTEGHTDARKVNAYNYEVGRIINIARASDNLRDRLKQSYHSIRDILTEAKTWVIDVIVTNPTFKKIIMNPATSHLIPRYVSPSWIHPVDSNYSNIKEGVLDHVAIVKKPRWLDGKQIEGAAFGEKAKLRGVCFGDRIQCLNMVQSSSSLDTCVTCPIKLTNRLTDLYRSVGYNRDIQSSSTMSSSSESQSQTTASKPTQQGQGSNPLSQFNLNLTSPPPVESGQTFTLNTSTDGSRSFTPDTQLQQNYQQFNEIMTQWIKENPSIIKGLITEPQSQSQPATDVANENNSQTPQQTQVEPQTNEMMKSLLDKFNLTADKIKAMGNEEIAKEFTGLKSSLQTMAELSEKSARKLEAIERKERVAEYEKILPQEAFTDARGFNKEEYDKLTSYLEKINFRKDLTTILGVGLIALKNNQIERQNITKSLKNNQIPDLFGASKQSSTTEDSETIPLPQP